MAKLTKTFQHFKDGRPADCLEIVIDYNPDTTTIDKIISVRIIDTRLGLSIDATELISCKKAGLKNYFDNIIEDIDWYEIYREQKPDKTYNKVYTVFDHVRNKVISDSLNILNAASR